LLAQVGEFSFVLERAGRDLGLVPFGIAEGGSQIFVASTVGLMVVTPFLADLGAKISMRQRDGADAGVDEAVPEIDEEALEALDDHVIIAGYATAARRLSQALQDHDVPLVVVTLSPHGATEAESRGIPVLRGDNGKSETLRHAGIERARMVVIADDQPVKAQAVAAVARELAPDARILVRTRFPADAPSIADAGANAVAADELESTLHLCGDVLSSYGATREELERHFDAVRTQMRAGELDKTPPPSDSGSGSGTPPSSAGAPPSDSGAPPSDSGDPPVSSRTESAHIATPPGSDRRIDTEKPVELRPKVDSACSQAGSVMSVLPTSQGCEECLRLGDSWVHLRVCMTCGHVGCCDSSPNRHATAHFHETGHPVVRSLEPGETWGWCYIDEREL
ncbi:MAG: NAD-binding protein, partial [Acidobacteriota bacterium]